MTPLILLILIVPGMRTGKHYGQWISSCELRDDGSTSGNTYIRYDGRDFIHLDKQRGIWIPTMHEAELTTQEWNSPEGRWGDLQRSYLDNDCIYWLKKFIEHGREDLEKRVRPEVKVWGRQKSDGVTRLQCLVYGFHPRAVDVKWVRNGEDHLPSDEMTPILPHPDGTYQIRVTAEVLNEGDTYSCHVDHSSLEEILTVKWEPEHGFRILVVVGVVIGSLTVCIGVIVYLLRKNINACMETWCIDSQCAAMGMLTFSANNMAESHNATSQDNLCKIQEEKKRLLCRKTEERLRVKYICKYD
ncbi:class I histocompatibility antigen, F10 alpha chain-like isoform 1-T1 [Mantella aurantiaca]